MPTFLERYAAFALDLDGVVWRGDTIIDGAVDGLRAIRAAGKPVLFLSNNAAYLPSWVIERLTAAGIEVDEKEILTSGMVVAEWIRAHGLAGQRALVLGVDEVVRQLADVVDVVPFDDANGASVVVAARDTRFDFERLRIAADAIRRGARFVAVNRDPTMPVPGGRLEPGTGSIVAAVETASGRRATIVGKPEMPTVEAASAIIGSEGVLMIGDRPDSDVAVARRAGWDAALVLTGVTQAGDDVDPVPDYIIESLLVLGADADGRRVPDPAA
jgi:HAD superfamily hydrolase (TIGR01450 family)